MNDDLFHDILTLAQIEFFMSYAALVIFPVLARTNWTRMWRETVTDIKLVYWCKLYPRFIRGNLNNGRII